MSALGSSTHNRWRRALEIKKNLQKLTLCKPMYIYKKVILFFNFFLINWHFAISIYDILLETSVYYKNCEAFSKITINPLFER